MFVTRTIIHKEIDFRAVKMTMAEVFAAAAKLQRKYPGREIYMDGDLYSLVSAEHKRQFTLDDFEGGLE